MLNKVLIIGNLGQDPDIRFNQSGKRIANLNVATSESWKDKQSGERKTKTEWHRVVIFNDALSGIAEKYLRKGSKVYLEGKIQTRKWQDQSGNDRYTTEIVLDGFNSVLTMLDGKQENSNSGGGGFDDGFDGGMTNNLEDEIPFLHWGDKTRGAVV